MHSRFLGVIRKEVQNFNDNAIQVVNGYPFNQRQTLNRIELYYNSKFESGETDSEGFRKFFYNVVHFPCDIATKAIDLDTKDFRLIPETAEAQVPTLFLGKEIKDWMKETHFGSVLNEIVENLPKYGSVVVKKRKDDVEIVNLHNLVNDQSVKCLEDSSYVLEKHVMSPEDLREMKEWDQDAIERIITLYAEDTVNNEIVVWERWGYCNRADIDEKYDGKDELAYSLIVCAGVEKFQYNKQSKETTELGECLFYSEVDEDDFPYRDVHWQQIPGRWLGIGQVERNFDAQIRQNELQNLKSKALYLTSRVLLQSTDDTVARNTLTDTTNGDILRVKSPITQVNMQLGDMGVFSSEEQRWDKNVQESSFTFETETGESLPSGTPFRLGALQKAASGGFFNFKREKLGLFLRDLFFEVIIPSFKKSKRRKHMLTIPKDDKDWASLQGKYVDFLVFGAVQEFQERTGFMPTLENLQAEKQRITDHLSSQKNIFVEMPDSFYDNAKFTMDLIITDEQIDLGQKLETISNLVQLIGANPAILQDDKLRSMIFAAMTLAGVSPVELGIDTSTQSAPQMPQLGQPQGMPQQSQPQGQGVPTATTSNVING